MTVLPNELRALCGWAAWCSKENSTAKKSCYLGVNIYYIIQLAGLFLLTGSLIRAANALFPDYFLVIFNQNASRRTAGACALYGIG